MWQLKQSVLVRLVICGLSKTFTRSSILKTLLSLASAKIAGFFKSIVPLKKRLAALGAWPPSSEIGQLILSGDGEMLPPFPGSSGEMDPKGRL